jgi:hypothetical protein
MGQQTGMVFRLLSEMDQESAVWSPSLNMQNAVPSTRAKFYFGWARPAISYSNISLVYEPQLSTAEVVKITAVYGKHSICPITFLLPKHLTLRHGLIAYAWATAPRFSFNWFVDQNIISHAFVSITKK